MIVEELLGTIGRRKDNSIFIPRGRGVDILRLKINDARPSDGSCLLRCIGGDSQSA